MTAQKSSEDFVTLGELITTQKGFAFKSAWFSQEGRKIVKVSNFSDNSVECSSLVCIPENLAQKYERYRLAAGDILIQTVGSWPNNPASVVGKVVRAPHGAEGALLNQNAVKLTPLPGVHNTYLYYALKTSSFSNYIVGTAQGAANQASVTLESIRGYCFNLPSFPAQDRIASILCAYDDLIENNTRRIEILEEMARRLYEEWLVQFRFPEHEDVEFKESELGLIPERWNIQSLYDVAEVTYGHPFKASQFNVDGVGLGIVRIRDIKAGKVKTYTSEEGKPKHLIENGDILVGMDGQFHMGKWAGGQAWLVQRVARFRPIEIGRYFLFLSLERPIKHLENTIVGTTVAHLSAKDLQELHVVMPDQAVLETASSFLEPIYDLEMKLRRKNANLRAQRDLLLPKLISGEIDVSDIPMPT